MFLSFLFIIQSENKRTIIVSFRFELKRNNTFFTTVHNSCLLKTVQCSVFSTPHTCIHVCKNVP